MYDTDEPITDVALKSDPAIDPLILDITSLLVGNVLTVSMCLFGVVTNLINIPLFRRQGYHDGVNVTLTVLAISDLGALLGELVYTAIVDPYIQEIDLVVSKVVIGVISGYWHEYFTRVSSVITAFAAFERCLCVTRPLKVKTMITTRTAVVVNVSIFVVHSLYLFPQFYTMYFDWAFMPERNKTVFVIYVNSLSASMFPITLYFTDMLFPYCTFLVLVVCCTVLLFTLKAKAKWRRTAVSSAVEVEVKPTSRHLTSKERKSGLLFLSVSIMCVVLLLPQHIVYTAVIFVREMAMDGDYSDIRTVVGTFTVLLQAINSSMTIFIYYKISTKYRSEFQKMMGKYDCLQFLKKDT
uniref:G-protein coupled receptors family 1 profile domain-containing protein n=1 Tax=Biomphalaria glabrata TaxID=6526 RepID=A0A2C9L8P3_BIOGL